MAKDPDLKNLFLDENLLIELAMRELKGKRPPSAESEGGRLPVSRGPKTKILREIESRGWTPRDLAQQIGVPAPEASALVRGGQRVTPEIAQRLARVFATSAEYWLNDDE
jgi:addiction module HigA family antidote